VKRGTDITQSEAGVTSLKSLTKVLKPTKPHRMSGRWDAAIQDLYETQNTWLPVQDGESSAQVTRLRLRSAWHMLPRPFRLETKVVNSVCYARSITRSA